MLHKNPLKIQSIYTYPKSASTWIQNRSLPVFNHIWTWISFIAVEQQQNKLKANNTALPFQQFKFIFKTATHFSTWNMRQKITAVPLQICIKVSYLDLPAAILCTIIIKNRFNMSRAGLQANWQFMNTIVDAVDKIRQQFCAVRCKTYNIRLQFWQNEDVTGTLVTILFIFWWLASVRR